MAKRNREDVLRDMIRRNEAKAERKRREGDDVTAGRLQHRANVAASQLARLEPDNDWDIPRKRLRRNFGLAS